MDPFQSKLLLLRSAVSTFSGSMQIGFAFGVVVACIAFIITMLYLLLDYKTRILEARKGIFRDFHFDKIEIADAANFPGFLISNSIIGFIFIVFFVTVGISAFAYPLFW